MMMKRAHYTKYYRVFKHDTAITEISTNDFKPVKASQGLAHHFIGNPVDVLCSIPNHQYLLLPDSEMFYGYTTLARAMERAKLGAQSYIASMIKQIEERIQVLKQYRIDHYDDLNVNLLEINIRKIEQEMHIK